MPKVTRRTYTATEKALLVGEIQRLYRRGNMSMRAATDKVGISEATYYAWVRLGVKAPQLEARSPVLRRSGDERRALVAEVEARVAGGATITAACQALGVTDKAFRTWRDELKVPAMRPVEITALVPVPEPAPPAITFAPAPPAPTPALTLHAPGGYRVEGLDAASVAAILRSLSC